MPRIRVWNPKISTIAIPSTSNFTPRRFKHLSKSIFMIICVLLKTKMDCQCIYHLSDWIYAKLTNPGSGKQVWSMDSYHWQLRREWSPLFQPFGNYTWWLYHQEWCSARKSIQRKAPVQLHQLHGGRKITWQNSGECGRIGRRDRGGCGNG